MKNRRLGLGLPKCGGYLLTRANESDQYLWNLCKFFCVITRPDSRESSNIDPSVPSDLHTTNGSRCSYLRPPSSRCSWLSYVSKVNQTCAHTNFEAANTFRNKFSFKTTRSEAQSLSTAARSLSNRMLRLTEIWARKEREVLSETREKEWQFRFELSNLRQSSL